MRHRERHRTHRTGWLRAAVLGANDGIVSTASLVLGVAAAGSGTQGVLVAGVAGLVAGAMSMAAGEYVSVSSQADTERADLARESKELVANPEQEHAELMSIYVKRGLDETLASNVATQLMRRDALAAHGRDELGISDTSGRATGASCIRLGSYVRRRGDAPTSDGALDSGCCTDVGCRRELTPLSCAVGLLGRTHRGRARDRLCHARQLLGGVGNGIDRWSGCPLWGNRLTRAPSVPSSSRGTSACPACRARAAGSFPRRRARVTSTRFFCRPPPCRAAPSCRCRCCSATIRPVCRAIATWSHRQRRRTTTPPCGRASRARRTRMMYASCSVHDVDAGALLDLLRRPRLPMPPSFLWP